MYVDSRHLGAQPPGPLKIPRSLRGPFPLEIQNAEIVKSACRARVQFERSQKRPLRGLRVTKIQFSHSKVKKTFSRGGIELRESEEFFPGFSVFFLLEKCHGFLKGIRRFSGLEVSRGRTWRGSHRAGRNYSQREETKGLNGNLDEPTLHGLRIAEFKSRGWTFVRVLSQGGIKPDFGCSRQSDEAASGR